MTASAWTRRDFLTRVVVTGGLTIGGLAVSGGLLGSCTSIGGGGDSLERAKRSGTIKIGIAGEQPFGFIDRDGRATGEAPEVARAVFAALGVGNVQPVQVGFTSLIAGLVAGRYDVVAAGLPITPQRCSQAAFSIPDYQAFTAFLVPRGNPQLVNTFAEVTAGDVRIGVISGTVQREYAREAGVPAEQIRPFETLETMLQAVRGRRVYCAASTDILLKDLLRRHPDPEVEVTAGFNPLLRGKEQITAGGFAFRKDDGDLRESFNSELARIHGNGEWLRIAEPFGFTEVNHPAPGVTTERLCSPT
ncbi:MAG: ectoine/hydroxyectoine ABC transporter substrate-binding protein EhuB [Pseudonocardiaceae bacterium]